MMLFVKHRKLSFSLLLLSSMLLSTVAIAEPLDDVSAISKPNINLDSVDAEQCLEDDDVFLENTDLNDKLKADEDFLSFLDAPQKYISSGVEALASTLDEFFSNDKVFYESSGTYLRLRGDMIRDENGELQYTGDIRFKLRLPNTKKKIKLTFESDADERRDNNAGQSENIPANAAKNNDYFAGLQATLGKKHAWQFKPSIGLRLGSTVEPYFRLRARRRYMLEKWSIHWAETAYWFNSTGTGLDSLLEFNNKITDDDLFRAGSFARWTNKTDYYELNQTFSMFHTLSDRKALSYYVTIYGISEPTISATRYLIGLTYRQRIHKDYLFFEIIPQIKYQKINDFKSEFSVLFRIEIIFKK